MKPTAEITAKIKARLAIRDANQTIKSNRRILVSTASGPLTDEEREIKRKGRSSAVLKHRAEKGAPAIFERIQRGENISLVNHYDRGAVAALQATAAAATAKTAEARETGVLIPQADFDAMSAVDRAEFVAIGGKVEGSTATAVKTVTTATAAPEDGLTISHSEFNALMGSEKAEFKALGGKVEGDAPPTASATLTMAEFRSLSPYARMTFIKGGGKLID